MANKETTLDDLAAMMQRGLMEVHEKMDKGFVQVNEKMDKGFVQVNEKMDQGFAELRDGQAKLEDCQEKLEQKFVILEFSLKDIRKEIAQLTNIIKNSADPERIEILEQRISVLEAKLAGR